MVINTGSWYKRLLGLPDEEDQWGSTTTSASEPVLPPSAVPTYPDSEAGQTQPQYGTPERSNTVGIPGYPSGPDVRGPGSFQYDIQDRDGLDRTNDGLIDDSGRGLEPFPYEPNVLNRDLDPSRRSSDSDPRQAMYKGGLDDQPETPPQVQPYPEDYGPITPPSSSLGSEDWDAAQRPSTSSDWRTPSRAPVEDPGGTQFLAEDSQSTPPPSEPRPGTVMSTEGEPDYVPPTSKPSYWAPTEREQEEAASSIDTITGPRGAVESYFPTASGAVRTGAAAAQALGTGVNYITDRLDPANRLVNVHAGIIESMFKPETIQRIGELRAKDQQYQLTDTEQRELQGYTDLILSRYNQIKDDPDEIHRYGEMAPISTQIGAGLLSALFSTAAGGGLSQVARTGARAANLGQRATRGAEYVADVAGQGLVDPTSLAAQPAVDSAIKLLQGTGKVASREVAPMSQYMNSIANGDIPFVVKDVNGNIIGRFMDENIASQFARENRGSYGLDQEAQRLYEQSQQRLTRDNASSTVPIDQLPDNLAVETPAPSRGQGMFSDQPVSGESAVLQPGRESGDYGPWEVFDPRSGEPQRRFNTEAQAKSYVEQVKRTTGQELDYDLSRERVTPRSPSTNPDDALLTSEYGPRIEDVPENELGMQSQNLRQDIRQAPQTTDTLAPSQSRGLPQDTERRNVPRELRNAVDAARPGRAKPMGEAEELAAATVPRRQERFGNVGSVIGSGVGGVTGLTSAPQDENQGPLSTQNFASKIAATTVGGLVGAIAGGKAGERVGSKGVMAAGRLIDSLIASGKLSGDLLRSHPATTNRIEALFALASTNLPDDAIVEVPQLASALDKLAIGANEAISARAGSWIDNPPTAGEVRAAISEPGRLEQIKTSMQELLVDAVTGTESRAMRSDERTADRAAQLGLTPRQQDAAWKYSVNASPETKRLTVDGEKISRAKSPAVLGVVEQVAREMSIPMPDTFVSQSQELNAAAGVVYNKKAGRSMPILIINRGIWESDLTDDELKAILMHELGHVADHSETAIQRSQPGILQKIADAFSGTSDEVSTTSNIFGRKPKAEDYGGNEYLKDLDRQMRGDYRTEDVSGPSLGNRIATALTDRTATVAEFERRAQELQAKKGEPPLEIKIQEKIRKNPYSIADERAKTELAPALQEVGDDVTHLEKYLVLRHDIDIADEVERSISDGVLSKDISFTDMTESERRRFTLAQNELKNADASESRLFEGVRKAADEHTAATTELERTIADLKAIEGEPKGAMTLTSDRFQRANSKLKLAEQRREKARGRVERAEERLQAAKDALETSQQERRAAAENRKMEFAARRGAEARAARKASGGATVDVAEEALSALEATLGPERWAKIESAAQKIWDTNRKTLQRKLESGQLSQEKFDLLTTKYPHYVRTDVADYFEKATGSSGPRPAGAQVGLSDIGIKRIGVKGTEKDRVNPILSTIDSLYSGEASIVRQEAGRDFVIARDSDPSFKRLFKEVAPDASYLDENTVDPLTLTPDEWVRPGYTTKNGEKTLTVWDGDTHRTFVIPKEWSQLVAPEAGALLGDNAVAQKYRQFMGLSKALITILDPTFQMVTSPLRDFGDAVVSMSTRAAANARREGASGIENALREAGMGAAYVPRAIVDYFMAIPEALKGLPSGTHSPRVRELMEAGAGFNPRVARDEQSLRRAMHDLQRTGGMRVSSPRDAMKALKNISTFGAEPIGARLEMIGRIAAANQERRYGGDLTQQSMAYKDATIDFLRGGTVVRQMNVPLMFLNAGVQSAAQVQRKFKQSPAGYMAAVTSMVALPIMIAEAYNRSDPERARRYEDRPQYLKDTGIILELPTQEIQEKTGIPLTGEGPAGEDRPNYLWLPLGSHAYIARIAREAMSKADSLTGLQTPETQVRPYNADDPLDVAAHYAMFGVDIMNMFSPIKGSSVGSVLGGMVTPGAQEALELSANKDFFRGNTIMTDNADARASTLSRGLAETANRIAGTEIRPSAVEHVIRGAGGYPAKVATAASDLAAGKDRPGERPIQEIPVLGAPAGRIVRDTGGQRLENLRDPSLMYPPDTREILTEAKMWTSDLPPVPNRYQDVLLSPEEQADWQDAYNTELSRALARVRRNPEWRRGDKKAVVLEVASEARERAAQKLRLTPVEIRRRLRREESYKSEQ